MFSGAFKETFATVQLGAGLNILQLVETGDKGPALDFIEITPSDGVNPASRLGRAHITADNGYVLYVNGEKIGTGGAALPNTDPAHSQDGWVKTDFYTFEAACEVPAAMRPSKSPRCSTNLVRTFSRYLPRTPSRAWTRRARPASLLR